MEFTYFGTKYELTHPELYEISFANSGSARDLVSVCNGLRQYNRSEVGDLLSQDVIATAFEGRCTLKRERVGDSLVLALDLTGIRQPAPLFLLLLTAG